MSRALNPVWASTGRIPTTPEVTTFIKALINARKSKNEKRLIKDREYKILKECKDEAGLYLLRIEVPGDSEGETEQYEYMREGHYKEGGIFRATEIHVAYFTNGMPVGGTNVARLIEGGWKIYE